MYTIARLAISLSHSQEATRHPVQGGTDPVATHIHPTAVVSPQAEIGEDVSIGPFSVIEAGVRIGSGCQLGCRVVIRRGTTMGQNNDIGDGAVLGGKPQHARVGNDYGGVTIGDRNCFRENSTVHAAMEAGRLTIVGSGNLLMVNAHVGHDCTIGDHAIIVNNVMLGGHSIVEDRAYLGGAVGVHQFCRVGRLAMVGGQAHVVQDVPPYVTVDGATSRVVGLNRIGLRRSGFNDEQMQQMKDAYRIMYRSGLTWPEAIAELRSAFSDGPAAVLAPFLQAGKRGFVSERRVPRGATIRMPDQVPCDDDKMLRRVG